MNSDIRTFEDIKTLVDNFYAKVRGDKLLGPVFEERIQDKWLKHLSTMYTFWETILLPGEITYRGTPFSPHATLPIDESHFKRWLELFRETVDAHFSGPTSEEAKSRAGMIAGVFQHKRSQIN